jgi:hypothetical protein
MITEDEFEKEMIKVFDDRYHSDIKPEALDKAELDETFWAAFKEYLHDVSNEIYNPSFEGSYIRLLFRDFIYNNYPFEEADKEE